MVTLRRLKEMVENPGMDQRTPSAKHLREREKLVAWKKLGEGVEIAAYQNGYALYRVGRTMTVFPIHACGDYQYGQESASHVTYERFEQGEWYLRLVLEGEDRLCWNQEMKNRRKTVSYSQVAEDWKALGTGSDPILDRVIIEEALAECLALLTNKQRLAVHKFYLDEKSQAQIAQEFGISAAAVSRLLSRAVQRMRAAEATPERLE